MRQFLTFLTTLICLALPAQAQPVTVFAAASLRGALTEIASLYDSEVTISFAGSGTLARQVAAGAPADVIILAHRDWANWLAARGAIQSDTLRDIAGGQLVVVGAKDAAPLVPPFDHSLLAALNGGRLAIGQRDAVPAGAYAKEWLIYAKAWETLEPHLAETDNVRAALALVAQGAAPLGVVYASDALSEPRVSILYTIPAQAHAPIRYPAAAVTDQGRAFLDRLTTPASAAIFAKHGFAP